MWKEAAVLGGAKFLLRQRTGSTEQNPEIQQGKVALHGDLHRASAKSSGYATEGLSHQVTSVQHDVKHRQFKAGLHL